MNKILKINFLVILPILQVFNSYMWIEVTLLYHADIQHLYHHISYISQLCSRLKGLKRSNNWTKHLIQNLILLWRTQLGLTRFEYYISINFIFDNSTLVIFTLGNVLWIKHSVVKRYHVNKFLSKALEKNIYIHLTIEQCRGQGGDPLHSWKSMYNL